jgi:hypothetical protein
VTLKLLPIALAEYDRVVELTKIVFITPAVVEATASVTAPIIFLNIGLVYIKIPP